MMAWIMPHDRPERLGLIPKFLNDKDPRNAREQLHANYAHGGGWMPFNGFTLKNVDDIGGAFLSYVGDPSLEELGRCRLRDELVIVFKGAWVAIVQRDGSYEISRMD